MEKDALLGTVVPAGSGFRTNIDVGGCHGHRVNLLMVPTFPAGDPRAGIPLDGAVTRYRVVFLLHRPGIALSGEYEIDVNSRGQGNSHLALSAPATLVTDIHTLKIEHVDEQGRHTNFVGHRNDRGFLGRIGTEIEASSFADALHESYSALAPTLSLWSAQLDLPVAVANISCTQIETGSTLTTLMTPFPERPLLIPSSGGTTPEFRSFAALYREALNSNSPPYQFLCLYKILEGIVLRREHVKTSPARINREAVRASEIVPVEEGNIRPWLHRIYYVRPNWLPVDFHTLFPPPVRGWKFRRIMEVHLTPLRKAVAHALTDAGQVLLSTDDLLHTRYLDTWLPLTKLMVRRMLKNEFPDQFLVGLGEDGNQIKRDDSTTAQVPAPSSRVE